MAILDHLGNIYRNGSARSSRIDDDYALPHVVTFSSLLQTWSQNYMFDRQDEATNHSRFDAVQMLHDPHLQALCAERSESVLNLPWCIEPEDKKDSVQLAVAGGITSIIRSTHRLRTAIRTLLHWGNWYGKSGLNCVWEWKTLDVPIPIPTGPMPLGPVPMIKKKCRVLGLKKHVGVAGDKISFKWDGTPLVRINNAERGALPNADIINTDVGFALVLNGGWRERVIIHKHDGRDTDYYDAFGAGARHGLGIRSQVYWLWRLKQDFVSWVVSFLEKFGPGLPVVEHDQGNEDSLAVAKRIAKQLNRGSVLTIPKSPDSRLSGGSVYFLEPPANSMAVITSLIAWVEQQIERFIVGQSMSAGVDTGGTLGGSGRTANFAEDTKIQKITADKDEIEETLTGSNEEPGFISIIKKYVYPWADFNLRWKFVLQEQDPTKSIQAVQGAAMLGVDFIKDEVRQLTGMSKPTMGDDVVGGLMPMETGDSSHPQDAQGHFAPKANSKKDGAKGGEDDDNDDYSEVHEEEAA